VEKFLKFILCRFAGAAREPAAQGIELFHALTARLKPCPDTCLVRGYENRTTIMCSADRIEPTFSQKSAKGWAATA